MFKERCHRLLMVRYWGSNIEPKSNKNSVGETYSKDKSSWKFYPSDLVIKNLKPDSVPRHYKMVYRSSVETITNFCILVNTSTMLGFSAFIISTKSSELVEMASVESVLGAFALFSYVALLYTSALQVPLRMYYSAEKENFLVKMPHLIPYRTKTLTLQPGTVMPPSKSQWKPWTIFQYTHIPSKTKLVILRDGFEVPMYYKKLLRD